MGQITKNQQTFLQSRGVDTRNMSFEQASQLISTLKENTAGFHKEVQYQDRKQFSAPRFDSQSAYVSYCKDLCIAMLQAHVEARKLDGKIEPIAVADLMNAAADAIKKAKASFE